MIMSKVQLVPNSKASAKAGKPVYYVPTTSGKWLRIQVSSEQSGESVDASGNGTGFNSIRKQVGFSYHATEESAKALIASAVDGMVDGKVIYVDQLEPIVQEDASYGKQYPYPFRFNGTELTLEQRQLVQAKAIETGRSLMQSGKPIYRRKVHTTILDSKSVILSPDNLDDINSFVATVLAATTDSAEDRAKELAALKAIAKAKRTPEQIARIIELQD